jgi:DNA-binding XRE family transcriptional regulator
MTQERLAHAADISMVTLARIETGRTDPRWTTLVQISEALGVDMAQLGAAATHLGGGG